MIVSEVGLTTSGSVNGLAGTIFPSAFNLETVCVTTAHSLAKPSTCAASFCKIAQRNEKREIGVSVARWP